MKSQWIFGAIACASMLLTAACDDDTSEPVDLTIDTFNVGLAGAFLPHEETRRQVMAEGIAGTPADVICLQEVWLDSDKENIAEDLSDVFPHAVWVAHDLDSTVDDAEDQNGDIPPPPTAPPCSGEDLEPILDGALSCIAENCSTIPGSDDGYTTSTACAQDSCIAQVATMILTDDPATLRCYACMVTGLPTTPIGDIRESCTTEVNGGLAFEGQSGVMVLSRYPITDSGSWVLPGTWNRRVVQRATVELPNEAEVDVYCNHLSPVFDDIAFPYTGDYGLGELDADGWANEQILQAEKLVDHVQELSGDRPAIILGDFNASRRFEVDGEIVVHEENVPTMDVLEERFLLAVPEDFVPSCTHCPENANTSDSATPVWIDHIFLSGIPAASVLSAERVYDEDVVEIDGGSHVPLSDHFGLRSVVTIEP